MNKLLLLALATTVLFGCASEGSSPGSAATAAEVAIPKEQLIANHTNTIVKVTFSNGDRAENTFGADHAVRSIYSGRDGSESNEGTWSLKGDDVICFTWKNKKWEDSCWKDYKVGDQNVSYEQGGKKRKARFTVAPI